MEERFIKLNEALIDKDNEIQDLRACQAVNEKEIQRLQKLITDLQRVNKSNLNNEQLASYFPMLTTNQISVMTKEACRLDMRRNRKGICIKFFQSKKSQLCCT